MGHHTTAAASAAPTTCAGPTVCDALPATGTGGPAGPCACTGATVPRPRRRLVAVPPRPEDERGITTAEYAVGTAAGAGLAGLMYTLLSGGFGTQLLMSLFDHVLGLLGIG